MKSEVHGWSIERHEVAGSTMDLARAKLAHADTRSAFVILAQQQTSGRGRQGRSWQSPRGGFYLTVAYPWEHEIGALSGLSLVVGLALRDSLGLAASAVQLKWPNDLIVNDGRKLAGILIEVISGAQGTNVLIGIGLNLFPLSLVNCDEYSSDQTPSGAAISLRELTSHPPDVELLLEHLIVNLQGVLQRFEESGFKPFRDMWLELAWLKGCSLVIDTGARSLQGDFSGVNDNGALLLETQHGVCEISSGHILSVTRLQN